jgi:hypothetical protein
MSNKNTLRACCINPNVLCNRLLSDYFSGYTQIYYRRLGNWSYKLAFKNEPKFWVDGQLQSANTINPLKVLKDYDLQIISIINSTLFYWWWIIISNEMDLTSKHIGLFPISFTTMKKSIHKRLRCLSSDLIEDYYKNSEIATYQKKRGETIFYRFFPFKSKTIIDKIDTILAEHFNFNKNELDFILNYDFKYRTGRE